MADKKKPMSIKNMADKGYKKIKVFNPVQFKFRGRKYTYTTPSTLTKLADKLKISKSDIKKLVKGDTTRIAYDTGSKQVKTIDISKPLLLKNFENKKLTNKQLLGKGSSGLKVFKKLPNNLDRKVVIVCDYKLKISEDEKKGTITFTAFINKNTNIENLCKNKVMEKYKEVNIIWLAGTTVSNIRVYENTQTGKKLQLLKNMKLRLRKPPILNMIDRL